MRLPKCILILTHYNSKRSASSKPVTGYSTKQHIFLADEWELYKDEKFSMRKTKSRTLKQWPQILIPLLCLVGFVLIISLGVYKEGHFTHFDCISNNFLANNIICCIVSDTMGEGICGASFGKMFTKAKPYLLSVGLQFGFAGTFVSTMASLNHGMSRFVFIVYRNAIAAFALAPFALIFERRIRPKMTISVFLQMVALGFLEPVIDQGFTFLGMQYTSASFASAVTNAVPSVTFVLAVILRIERVKIKEVRSQAKVIGTLVTFAGALLMTLYKGPVIHLFNSGNTTHHQQGGSHSPHTDQSHKHWVIGTLFIVLGCVAWSSFFILQSITVRRYPAELSLSSMICLMGALQAAVVALVAEHHHPRSWAIRWDYRLFAPLYSGIVSSGIAYYVQGLVMQSRGPVFVTAFNPLCVIIVAALGSILLGEQLHLGSIIGAIIIALGLYFVVWGKRKEHSDLTPPSATTKETETQHLPIISPTDI